MTDTTGETVATRDGEARGEKRPSREYTVGEEIANSITHGVGVAFSIAALTLLVAFAVLYGDTWALASGIVFGISLILLYTGSTLYHALPFPKARHVFKIIDHSAIYVLIAGSYTPFCLVTMRNDGGWWMFALVWALAVVGISTEGFWAYRPRWLSAVVYLLMGWLAVFMIRPMMANLDMRGLWLLRRRRSLLHGGHGLLRDQAGALLPHGVAPVGAGGQRLPRRGRAAVRGAERQAAVLRRYSPTSTCASSSNGFVLIANENR